MYLYIELQIHLYMYCIYNLQNNYVQNKYPIIKEYINK